jgi:hypothetical protein
MGLVFALVPGPAFMQVRSSAFAPPQTNINHVLSHHNAVISVSHQEPSSNGPVSGPVFLSPSVGLDVLFLSHDRLSNVLDEDDSCLHTHLVNHGLSADSMSAFEARQSLAFHLMTGMCVSVASILPGETQDVGCRLWVVPLHPFIISVIRLTVLFCSPLHYL